MTVTVHIAGPVENGRQNCRRCGAALIDYCGKTVMIAISEGDGSRILNFWPVGGFIGHVGAGAVLMSKDATCIDEIACGIQVQ